MDIIKEIITMAKINMVRIYLFQRLYNSIQHNVMNIYQKYVFISYFLYLQKEKFENQSSEDSFATYYVNTEVWSSDRLRKDKNI